MRVYYQIPTPAKHSLTLTAGSSSVLEITANEGSKLLSMSFALPSGVSMLVTKDDQPDYMYFKNKCGSIRLYCMKFEYLKVVIYNGAATSMDVYCGVLADMA